MIEWKGDQAAKPKMFLLWFTLAALVIADYQSEAFRSKRCLNPRVRKSWYVEFEIRVEVYWLRVSCPLGTIFLNQRSLNISELSNVCMGNLHKVLNTLGQPKLDMMTFQVFISIKLQHRIQQTGKVSDWSGWEMLLICWSTDFGTVGPGIHFNGVFLPWHRYVFEFLCKRVVQMSMKETERMRETTDWERWERERREKWERRRKDGEMRERGRCRKDGETKQCADQEDMLYGRTKLLWSKSATTKELNHFGIGPLTLPSMGDTSISHHSLILLMGLVAIPDLVQSHPTIRLQGTLQLLQLGIVLVMDLLLVTIPTWDGVGNLILPILIVSFETLMSVWQTIPFNGKRILFLCWRRRTFLPFHQSFQYLIIVLELLLEYMVEDIEELVEK